MQYYNVVFSLILLFIVALVYRSKKFSPRAQAFIVFLILVILMTHHLILMNVKLFRNRRDRFDQSFLADLDYIKNTDQVIEETSELKGFQSCVDLNGVTVNLKTRLYEKDSIVIKTHSNIPIKEIVYNVLLERYNQRQVLNFYMNFQTYTPPLSIFNLGHLESKFLYYKIEKNVKTYQAVVFHDIKDEKQLDSLLEQLRDYESSKILIVLVKEELQISKVNKNKVISCYELDNDEFRRYVKRREPVLKDLTTDEIIDAVGKDPKTIDELFRGRKKLSKSDLDKFLNQYPVDLKLQEMDECKLSFLKNMLVEYYKLNHRTQNVLITKLVHKNFKCGQSASLKSMLNQLYRQKVIISNGKNVKFYSTVVRNAFMRYFKDHNGFMQVDK